jgi:hypothetical protein
MRAWPEVFQTGCLAGHTCSIELLQAAGPYEVEVFVLRDTLVHPSASDRSGAFLRHGQRIKRFRGDCDFQTKVFVIAQVERRELDEVTEVLASHIFGRVKDDPVARRNRHHLHPADTGCSRFPHRTKKLLDGSTTPQRAQSE